MPVPAAAMRCTATDRCCTNKLSGGPTLPSPKHTTHTHTHIQSKRKIKKKNEQNETTFDDLGQFEAGSGRVRAKRVVLPLSPPPEPRIHHERPQSSSLRYYYYYCYYALDRRLSRFCFASVLIVVAYRAICRPMYVRIVAKTTSVDPATQQHNQKKKKKNSKFNNSKYQTNVVINLGHCLMNTQCNQYKQCIDVVRSGGRTLASCKSCVNTIDICLFWFFFYLEKC
jgi:hypothetical protein